MLANSPSVTHPQRAEHRDDAVHPREDIGRTEVEVEGHFIIDTFGQDAGLGVDDRGVCGALRLGPVLAEPTNRQHDQLWVDPLQRAPVEPEFRHHTRPEVLDHDIGVCSQPSNQLWPIVGPQVDTDVPFPAVLLREVGRQPCCFAPPQPSDIPVGRLDLHDVGTKVRQCSAGDRAGKHP